MGQDDQVNDDAGTGDGENYFHENRVDSGRRALFADRGGSTDRTRTAHRTLATRASGKCHQYFINVNRR